MKTKYKTIILGAGVAGLGAGSWLKHTKEDFLIIEKLNEIPLNLNQGVHYLHSIPQLPFGAELKEITLTDGVLSEGKIRHRPELQDALQYSEKVRAIQHPSSIFEIGKRTSVFIPKSNNMNDYIKKMIKYIGNHFLLGQEVIEINLNKKQILVGKENIEFDNLISTIPLNKFLQISNDKLFQDINFSYIPINILNFKVDKIVPNWLINLYVPDPKQKTYRLSILNNVASIESIDKIPKTEFGQIKELFNMFHLDINGSKSYVWNQGKIVSIDIDTRMKILNHFVPLKVFPIGRFGIWNNKLLIDATINQAYSVCKYITSHSIFKEDINKLINSLI